ncbi:MAG TPA: glycosyltransferase [Longimicrobiales bacterium]|nr:glycosyltransferase [Longimicrobiales bacterium]
MSAPDFAVLHLDSGRVWAGGQNQVRLLMRELAARGVRQLCLCPSGSPLETRLRAESLPVRGIPWRGPADPRAAAAVWRALADHDIVHCHDAHALQIALAATALRQRPVVASRRVHFTTSARKWNRAARVLAISETVRAALLRSGVDADRIRLVPSGIDVDEVRRLPPLEPSLRSRLSLPAGARLVGNIGHLHGYKGQEVIPRAAARLTGAHWAIIGEGPKRGELEAATAAEGVGDRVHLTGEIRDARRALAEFDVFVFTSTQEPLGTSVVDAMASGVPIVGADAAGSAEILGPVHAETGASLVPPGDAESLAAAVARVLAEPDLAAKMVAAQDRRLADFRVERTAELTLEQYAELLRGR